MKVVPFNHPAWIEIDIGQFKKNLQIIKRHIGTKTKLCLPIKANAYGHGLVTIAQAAVAEQVDYLGVSCLQEGIILRQAKIKTPILVLGAVHAEQIDQLIAYDLEFTISSNFKAVMVAEVCSKLNKQAKVHLELDTGMNRTGVRSETATQVLDYLLTNESFILKGVYSHFASADEPGKPFTNLQIQKFQDFVTNAGLINNPNVICHLASSAGITYFPESYFDMVRPGLLAFGYTSGTDMPASLSEIKPCLSIKAKVAYFKTVLPDEGISYNHTYITKEMAHVLTIPLGYGDGLRRCLSNKGSILLNGKRYPMVGNICMDQFMVDIGNDSGYVGDIVTIIGKSIDAEITIQEMSKLCNTIAYEILCGFNDRLPRIYLNHET